MTARVTAGQKLIVPREATALMASRPDLPVPATDSRPTTKDTVVAAVNSAPFGRVSAPSGSVKVSYQVKRGDTLASIARVFSTTVNAIRTWNRIPGTQIRAGERLTIYTSRAN
jgi:LysM repeat protein